MEQKEKSQDFSEWTDFIAGVRQAVTETTPTRIIEPVIIPSRPFDPTQTYVLDAEEFRLYEQRVTERYSRQTSTQ